jgi:hypothetical protein
MRRIWTTKRLFVSSTFVDMIPERDLIAKRVLPRLRSRGEARANHVIGVDLRWGIAVDSDAERRLVARQCLEAVDACRPYLLAMSGRAEAGCRRSTISRRTSSTSIRRCAVRWSSSCRSPSSRSPMHSRRL